MKEKNRSREFIFDIAGIKIAIDCFGNNWQPLFNEDLLRFRGEGALDLKIKARYCELSEIPKAEKIFDSGGIWQLLRNEKEFIFLLSSKPTGDVPYGVCIVNNNFSAADLYLRPFEIQNKINPLEYPLDEVLMVHLLSLGKGVIIHGCGLDYQGKGILLAGISGSGKSTMAGLWQGENEVAILSDDRVIIREENNALYMYGTPWHGDANVCANKKVKLEKIYFLSHDSSNNTTRLSSLESVVKLMVCCFTTFWDKKGMEFSLSFLTQIAEKTPCFKLGFLPDESVVKLLKEENEVYKC